MMYNKQVMAVLEALARMEPMSVEDIRNHVKRCDMSPIRIALVCQRAQAMTDALNMCTGDCIPRALTDR